MKTQKKTLRGIVTSSALTLALAVGLLPAQGLAFAVEQAESQSSSNEQTEATQTEASSDASSAEDAVQQPEGTAEAEPVQEMPAGEESQPTAPQYTSSSQGHTAATLPLQETAEPQAGAIEYGGLAYAINPEDPDTATVVGLATDKPRGDVYIQPQVASDGKLYSVTSIKCDGGGGFTA